VEKNLQPPTDNPIFEENLDFNLDGEVNLQDSASWSDFGRPEKANKIREQWNEQNKKQRNKL